MSTQTQLENRRRCSRCYKFHSQKNEDPYGRTFCKKCFKISQLIDQTYISFFPKKGDQNPFNLVSSNKDSIIQCPNVLLGCTWEKQSSQLQSHMSVCPKQKIICNNEGCLETFPREDLNTHLKKCLYRIIKCSFCFKKMPIKHINEHQMTCPKCKVNCPNNCGEMINRDEVNIHIKDSCSLTQIICPFKDISTCNKEIKRGDLYKHLNEDNIEHSIACFNHTKKFLSNIDEMVQVKIKSKNNEFMDKMEKMVDEKITKYKYKMLKMLMKETVETQDKENAI